MLGTTEIIVIALVLLTIFISIVIPIILIVKSKRVLGAAKTLWIIIVILISWLGFIVFLIANPKKAEKNNNET